MNNFFNDHSDIATEALLGCVKGDDDASLHVLDGLPHIKCILRGHRPENKVAILSGGGAGHEPAHAGFIGSGMLTGIISGEIFASPSVDAVLAAILHVTTDAGCLLIVKNYTGDRLNFGLAAEKAKNLGLKVAMVIVGDDVATADNNQPRGIAGTLFIHKMAGFYSQQGLDLDNIKLRLEKISSSIHSMGIAYSTCSLPGQESQRQATAELGLGIHGEPGVETFEPISSRDSVNKLVARLKPLIPSPDTKIGILVNNLGATSNIEMSVIMNDLLDSELAENIDLVFGPDTFMTALNMHGFSVSMIMLTDEIRTGLMSPTKARSWRPYGRAGKAHIKPLSPLLTPEPFTNSHDPKTHLLLTRACDALIQNEDLLNQLDAQVGDGDTGTTFANGARAILEKSQPDGLPLADISALFLTIGHVLGTTMGGSSGILLSIFFTSAGNAYKKNTDLGEALQEGINVVCEYGGAKLGDRTMLDAAIPAINNLADKGSIDDASAEAHKGANATAELLDAKAGRSSYLRSDSLKGIKDPGAVAMTIIFDALAQPL